MTKTYKGAGAVGVGCAAIVAFFALWFVLVAIGSIVLMFAWNLVLPSLLGWPELTFPMAFGLSLLLGIIGGAFTSRSRT
jgi:hypothetical protein